MAESTASFRLRDTIRVIAGAIASRSLRDFYDRIARDYDRLFTTHRIHAGPMVAALARNGVDPGRGPLLDLGCGTGLLARTLMRAGYSVVGLDLSRASLGVLRESSPEIRAVHGHVRDLPFADGSFRGIACLGAWRHFVEPRRVAEEAARVLTDDGVLVVGYFPPRLGGILPSRGGSIARAYSRCVRLLGHDDAVDSGHEQRTRNALDAIFALVERVPSGPDAHLLVARGPRRDTRG